MLAQGTVLTAEAAEKLLAADIPVISVRMEGTEGVEVRKITEAGGLIESLADRIAGRCPLEDVVNPETEKSLPRRMKKSLTTRLLKLKSIMTV